MAQWLSYLWEYEGQRAEYRVDMQYWDLLPVLSYTQMILVSASPKKAEAAAFIKKELKSCQQLQKRLVESLSGPCVLVGELLCHGLHNFYFYTSDTETIHLFSQICSQQTGLTVQYSHSWEESFPSYYRFLYPDDKRLQSVENAAFIEQCRKEKEPLDVLRRIEMNFAFPDSEDREHFLTKALQGGLVPGECFIGGSPTHPYCCRVYGYSLLEIYALNRLTARGFYAAAMLDGVLEQLRCAD